jgi:hypothetical protein
MKNNASYQNTNYATRARNIDYKNPAINEPSLIDELISLTDST